VSRVHRVFAGVSGSPGSLQALRYAAGVARVHDSALIAVLAWTPPGGELADRAGPSPYLRQLWKDAAWQRLWNSLELAFGGLPADAPVEPLVFRGDAGSVLVRVADSDDDLLVVGAGRRGALRRMGACRPPVGTGPDGPRAARVGVPAPRPEPGPGASPGWRRLSGGSPASVTG